MTDARITHIVYVYMKKKEKRTAGLSPLNQPDVHTYAHFGLWRRRRCHESSGVSVSATRYVLRMYVNIISVHLIAPAPRKLDAFAERSTLCQKVHIVEHNVTSSETAAVYYKCYIPSKPTQEYIVHAALPPTVTIAKTPALQPQQSMPYVPMVLGCSAVVLCRMLRTPVRACIDKIQQFTIHYFTRPSEMMWVYPDHLSTVERALTLFQHFNSRAGV